MRIPALAGGVLENFVLMELRKQSTWSETQPQFFYWRTASGQEVDIVLEVVPGRLVGVEAKANATLGRGDVRGLKALADTVGKRWLRGAGPLHWHRGHSIWKQSARYSAASSVDGA